MMLLGEFRIGGTSDSTCNTPSCGFEPALLAALTRRFWPVRDLLLVHRPAENSNGNGQTVKEPSRHWPYPGHVKHSCDGTFCLHECFNAPKSRLCVRPALCVLVRSHVCSFEAGKFGISTSVQKPRTSLFRVLRSCMILYRCWRGAFLDHV